MYIWKQWKKPRTKVDNLRKLGIPADKAYQWDNSRLGYWRIAGSPVLKCSITNERLAAAGHFAVYAIIYSDKADIITRKDNIRILSNSQIVTTKAAEVFDQPAAHKPLLDKLKAFLHTGTIE